MINRPQSPIGSSHSHGEKINRFTHPASPESDTHVLDPATIEAQDTEAFRFLRTLSIFSTLSSKDLVTLASSSRFSTLASGEYVTHEGDEESLYGFVVVSGRLAMMKNSVSGKQLVVELLAPGDIFGLLITLTHDNVPSLLSARAQCQSEVLWVQIKTLNVILQHNISLYKEFMLHLLHSLQSSYSISRGLAHDRVEVRIASILTNLAIKFSRTQPSPDEYTIDITRQQIADLTGTTPETAIRVTRAMQRDGYIDIKKPGVIRIVDIRGLHELADEE